jgi:hypothetical protein
MYGSLTFILQLQDKATVLTAERKKRGKTVPEGLATAEDIRAYHQIASHVVLILILFFVEEVIFAFI